MVRVLFDTNVLVSALIKTGKPRQLFKVAAAGKLDLVISKQIVEEFARVTTDPKIRRYVNRQEIASFIAFVTTVAKFVEVRSRLRVIKEDPEDNQIIRAAYDGRASYIVSGDRHLLKIKNVRGIKIITVDEMLEILSGVA